MRVYHSTFDLSRIFEPAKIKISDGYAVERATPISGIEI